MKATNNIDLDNNEIKNLVLEKQADDPQTNIEAKIFYNTTEKKIKYNNGEEWKEIGGEGGGGESRTVESITAGSVNLETNKDYYLNLTANTTLIVPAPKQGVRNEILVQVKTNATLHTITLNNTVGRFNPSTELTASGYFNLIIEYDWNRGGWFYGYVYKS